MISRAIALVGVLALSLGLMLCSGCAGCGHFGPEPPAFKLCNGSRLMDEFAWFYADVQDLVFGVNYYTDINREFGGSPYID